jgi:hypothetical protein
MALRIRLENVAELQELASAGNAAVAGTLCSAWAILLHCYTSSEEVYYGYQDPISHDGHYGGEFAGIPVIKLAVGDHIRLPDLVKDAEDQSARAVPHDVPTATETPEKRQFNTVLQLRTSSTTAVTLGPSKIVLPEACRLRLLAKHMNGSLSLFLEWWSCDMTMEQAMGVASTFNKSIAYIFTRSNITIAELDLLSDVHLRQILKFSDFPLERVDKCVHEIIKDRVMKQPESDAICAWDGSVTYKELDDCSSRLAGRLIGLGVGAESRVALAFEKSKWAVVAMIGVLKAGGCFVPLDPSHPISRLDKLVQTVGASTLLCSRNHLHVLAGLTETVVSVDEDLLDSIPANSTPIAVDSLCSPHNACYIGWTSGSSGMPKV